MKKIIMMTIRIKKKQKYIKGYPQLLQLKKKFSHVTIHYVEILENLQI